MNEWLRVYAVASSKPEFDARLRHLQAEPQASYLTSLSLSFLIIKRGQYYCLFHGVKVKIK